MTFTFVSGNAGLDLAGTVMHRRTDRTELLTSPADLARWTVQAGLLDTVPPATPDDLERATALREAIYRLATEAETAGPADRDLLNEAAGSTPVALRLTSDGVIRREGGVRAALSSVARSAVELLGDTAASAAIRECEHPDCTRLYVDTSRRGGRRWCDMRQCGNRAKVAAFRARREA